MIGSELQAAIFKALTDAQICEGRVFDTVSPGAAFPYLTIGDDQVLDDSNSCGEAFDVINDIHIWSRPAAGSKAEAKAIRSQIHPLLIDGLPIDGFIVNAVTLESARTLRDPDGVTQHGVLTYRFSLDPA